MTPEQLDMHKRLQPLYKRVMGEWKSFDRAVFIKEDVLLYFRLRWANDPDDRTLWFRTDIEMTVGINKDDENLIRIPLTIDSEHPERGLWGMLKNKEKMLDDRPTGVMLIMDAKTTMLIYQASDPTTAILKALCEQEGV